MLPHILLFAVLAFDPGTPTLRDVWVDPVHGSDSSDGASRTSALRTLGEAWRRIPAGTTLTEGVRIQLMAGVHRRDTIPHYFESRWGTRNAPIVIQSADGSRTARVEGDFNLYDVRYLYLIGLDMRPLPAGDVVHCEKCDHLLVRDCHLDGGAREAQETFKANQSQHVYVERSEIHGAYDNAIDLVAVQYGHLLHNKIYDAEDWCAYAKGGSAYLLVYGNEISRCGTGGFTAGQGTGFQFMTPPWLHYEAYDVRVVNNHIHETEGAGLGVNGGYNILLAHNTLERVGTRSHLVEIVHGGRSCDGEAGEPTRARCAEYLAMGGWGNTLLSDGENYTRIPNRNVFVYNNLIVNPEGVRASQHFSIAANFPNVQIRGNTIVNAADEEEASLLAQNQVNGAGHRGTFTIPDFGWEDAPSQPPVPAGTLSNAGIARSAPGRYRATKRRATSF
ncbi:MAG TPA: right-handed parallel beta-helix repeat-containing protein [Thermoanaerobaculia bacterium]